MSGAGAGAGGLAGIRAITLDFGNTLVPVPATGLWAVVEAMAERLAGPCRLDPAAFLTIWREERGRQFREDVPRFREADIAIRLQRTLARLRGMSGPPAGVEWDDEAAAARSAPDEIALGIDVYSAAYIEGLPPDPSVQPLLARLAGRYRLAVLSNWPIAVAIDRYVEAAGWAPHFDALVVSQRVGTIKPDVRIFRAAEAAFAETAAARGDEPPVREAILHVGDDWAADVVGASRAGWQVAWLRNRPADSPLPSSSRDDSVEPALVIDQLADLEAGLQAARGEPGAAHGALTP